MSPELKQFYVHLQAWIDAGMPNHKIFFSGRALCSLRTVWTTAKRYGSSEYYALKAELAVQFATNGLDVRIPFNESPLHYLNECGFGTLYENPARFAWVREHAAL